MNLDKSVKSTVARRTGAKGWKTRARSRDEIRKLDRKKMRNGRETADIHGNRGLAGQRAWTQGLSLTGSSLER